MTTRELEWVSKDGNFQKIYQTARSYLNNPERMRPHQDMFMKSFLGAIWQVIAVAWVQSELSSKNLFLLSPDATLEFYLKLYPKKKIIEHLFGFKTLNGVSVPDGLATPDREKIVPMFVYEYTVIHSGDERADKYFRDKERAFKNQRRYNQALCATELKFVVPNDTYLPSGMEELAIRTDCNHGQFAELVHDVFYTYVVFGDALIHIANEEIKRQYGNGLGTK